MYLIEAMLGLWLALSPGDAAPLSGLDGVNGVTVHKMKSDIPSGSGEYLAAAARRPWGASGRPSFCDVLIAHNVGATNNKGQTPGEPSFVERFVLLHELGHCLDERAHTLDSSRSDAARELFADAFAACVLSMGGASHSVVSFSRARRGDGAGAHDRRGTQGRALLIAARDKRCASESSGSLDRALEVAREVTNGLS
jgi:hypothetical protein